jgi:flagella basal body P-ring formation protein FlgA
MELTPNNCTIRSRSASHCATHRIIASCNALVFRLLFPVLLFAVIGTPASANEFHSHKDIQVTAESYLTSRLEQTHTGKFKVRIGSLDSRLKLSQCDMPLEAFSPPGARLYGKTTVGVRCTGSQPWKIFVPSTLVLYEDVLIVSRTIVRGEVLGPADLTVVRKQITGASQTYIRDMQQAVGMIAKRSIPNGKILTAHMVQAPRLVRAGQEVILLATTPQLEVRMKGKALADGSRGDVIHVRNLRSKRVVEGVVTHAGVVKVSM